MQMMPADIIEGYELNAIVNKLKGGENAALCNVVFLMTFDNLSAMK
jgi:hypothetical protein